MLALFKKIFSKKVHDAPMPTAPSIASPAKAEEIIVSRRNDDNHALLMIRTVPMQALCVLSAWEQKLSIRGGFAFVDELEKCRLDYSVISLDRIDSMLDYLRNRYQADEQKLSDTLGLQNTLLLLAFYVGEVISRARVCPPEWVSFSKVLEINPPLWNQFRKNAFESSVTAIFPSLSCNENAYLMPLVPLSQRLTGVDVNQSIYSHAITHIPKVFHRQEALHEKSLPKLPPQYLPIDIQAQLPLLHGQRAQMSFGEIPWDEHDDLVQLFQCSNDLLMHGRVVWGVIIQANGHLFDAKHQTAAPGEVVYDPQGRIPLDDLYKVAEACGRLKGVTSQYEQVQFISDYLANERIRVFGIKVPLISYPLMISTTVFHQWQLPKGALCRLFLPLVIDEKRPGFVRPLPQWFWTEQMLQDWQ